MIKHIPSFLIIITLGLSSCTGVDNKEKLFTLLPASATGVDFENTVVEDEHFNIMTYEYLYNGAGVAVGDINNDGLADLYFTGNMVNNKLYLNKGHMQFEDITSKAGVAGRQRWKTGTSMADVNGDGLTDIFVCYSGPGTDEDRRNELYINKGLKDGVPYFEESAAKYGLDAPGTFTTQCAFFDMDHDGDLDAFMVNHADMFYNSFYNTTRLRNTRHPKFGNRLYRNDGGHFTDISQQAGIYGGGLNFGLSVAISDLNKDGWPDIYTTNDYDEQDFLYLNNHNNTFTEVLKKSIGHLSKFSMGSDIGDINNDGLPDIITLDMLPEDNYRQKLLKGADGYDTYQKLVDSGFHHQNMRNMLQLNMGLSNEGVPQFSEIGQLAGMSNTDWSWAPLLADFDNDGWNDLFITNGYLRDFTNMDFLKYSHSEQSEAARQQGQTLETWQMVKQLSSTRISNYFFLNNHQLGFNNATQSAGLDEPTISNGAAYADLDNDGDLDLIVNNINSPCMLYENNSKGKTTNHYLSLKLQAANGNTSAIGATVFLAVGDSVRMKEVYAARGFQSSVDPVTHFGLGNHASIDSVTIKWPDGTSTSLQHPPVDTLLNIKQSGNEPVFANAPATVYPFEDYTISSGFNFQHAEEQLVDFKIQYLLPHQVSKQGPFLTKGDVNGDGLEDVFIGGNRQSPGKLFLQSADGHFTLSASQPWQSHYTAVDEGCLLFDADNDNDLDLYIVKGGSDHRPGDEKYQHQLYINEGKGVFSFAPQALPLLVASGSCISAADYDKDGDLDLFIGGRIIPGLYPSPTRSFLLRNESKPGTPVFKYADEQKDSVLLRPGMVTTAVWADINKDSWPDLIIAGEFMPVTVFENQKGILKLQSKKYGTDTTSGWWNKLIADDIDGDGDIDLIAGNIGLNTQFKVSQQEPATIYYGDFDNNGSMDPLFTYYIQHKKYAYASLDELVEQLPLLRKKFLKYEQYASAGFDDILSPEQLQRSSTVQAVQQQSCYFENDNGVFKAHALPVEAQFSALSGLVVYDWNGDGKKDILATGNYFPWRVQLGRMDACRGWVLQGDGKGNFKAVYPTTTGLNMDGDIRDMIMLRSKPGDLFIASRNNDKAVVYLQKRTR